MEKILLTLFSFLSIICFSQEPSYHQYTTHNGLPSSEIYDVIQDKYGHLWFSSNFGLSRYDGYKFQQYTTDDGLTDNTVYNFFKGPNDDIWCSTGDRSLFIIRGDVPTFTPYKWNKKLTENEHIGAIKEVSITEKNEVYITFIGMAGYLSINEVGEAKKVNSTMLGGQSIWHSVVYKNDQCFNMYGLHKPSQTIANFTLFSFKHTGYYWRNVSIHLPKKKTSVLNLYKTLVIIKNKHVEKKTLTTEIVNLGRYTDSTFWVSTRGDGIHLYNTEGDLLETLLPGKSVSGFTKDDQGGVWATTLNNGVFHFKNRNVKSRKFNIQTSNIVSLISNKESLYLGYVNGEIIKYSNGNFSKKKPFQENRPAYFCSNKFTEDLYAFSCGSVLKNEMPYIKKYSYSDATLSFTKGKKDILMLFNQHTISVFENQKLEKTIENKVTGKISAVLSNNNGIYIGAYNGLFLLKGDKLKNISNLGHYKIGRVNTLQQFEKNLIIGTAGQGVILFDKKNPILQITTEDGLTSNFIQKILVQNNQTIWVATNSGLNKITFNDKNQYKIDQITAKEGLNANEINDIALHKDTVWVATKTGLSYFHQFTRFKNQNTINNHLKISDLKVNDKLFRFDTNPITLDYNQNRVEISFNSISFNENQLPLYRFKLKDLETKWNYSTNRKAVYPGLQPGQYTFIVQLKGENGEWLTQSQTLQFSIHPPFWKTNWFLAMAISLFILFNYLFFRYRILRFNGALLRELLRLSLKRIKKKRAAIVVKEGSGKVKIMSESIKYVEAEGNYIKIYHDKGKTMTRKKISEFLEIIPDKLEYVQVRRSYIVRIDRVEQKGKKSIIVDGETINVGSTYLAELDKIQL